MNTLIKTLCCLCGLHIGSAAANGQELIGETTAGRSYLRLHFQNQLVDADIRGATLAKVADALQKKAGIQIHFNDPAIAKEIVSARIRGGALAQAVAAILGGYSYVSRVSTRSQTFVVLSTPPKRAAGEVQFLSSPIPAAIANTPFTLEDFRPLAYLADQAGADTFTNAAPEGEDETPFAEERVRRALDVLNSPHRQLYPYAIDELASSQDQRAVEPLVRLARQVESRSLATDALARLVVKAQFADPATVTLLQEFTKDPDENVRQSAAYALEALQQAGGSE